MTRKRYVKLLMANGWSRNAANHAAKEVREDGTSYNADYYHGFDSVDIYSRQYQELYETVKQTVDNLIPCIKRLAEALAAGVSAFGEAVARELNAVDAE